MFEQRVADLGHGVVGQRRSRVDAAYFGANLPGQRPDIETGGRVNCFCHREVLSFSERATGWVSAHGTKRCRTE